MGDYRVSGDRGFDSNGIEIFDEVGDKQFAVRVPDHGGYVEFGFAGLGFAGDMGGLDCPFRFSVADLGRILVAAQMATESERPDDQSGFEGELILYRREKGALRRQELSPNTNYAEYRHLDSSDGVQRVEATGKVVIIEQHPPQLPPDYPTEQF